MSTINRFSGFALAAGATLMMLTGCSKKLNQFQADYFSVNPNPLEVTGDRVPATVTARIPAKFFVKNAQVTVTPYLCFEGERSAPSLIRSRVRRCVATPPSSTMRMAAL